jgi:putative DNA primase/helicase
MNAETLAQALGAVRSGRQWKCKCVAHEDQEPSMIIFNGRENVQVRCLAGCEQTDIIDRLRSRGLWNGSAPSQRIEPRVSDLDRRRIYMRNMGRNLFAAAGPTKGTLAQDYLESREIWHAARLNDDIRFHPKCPRENDTAPALVIAMRDFKSHSLNAVQRIFIDRNARKTGAMMLGPAGGCAMMLGPINRHLHIAEGLESGLSVVAMDKTPVWALGSAGAICTFSVLDGVDQLTIWGDNDAAGRMAAMKCRLRWRTHGARCNIYIAEGETGADPNDVWRERLARG